MYVYDISKDLNIIILYTLVNAIAFYLTILVLYKFLNKRMLFILYKLSFIMSLISIALTYTISESKIYMVFITQIFLTLTHICYYLPHEAATCKENNNKDY